MGAYGLRISICQETQHSHYHACISICSGKALAQMLTIPHNVLEFLQQL
jgi:hypothetical protein